MRQTIAVWLREFAAEGRTKDLDWLCVCSDKTVNEKRDDDVVLHTQDLGIPTTTDVGEIHTWSRRHTPGLRLVFTTYQSGAVLTQGLHGSGLRFDIAIMDEAHKTVGDKAKLFAHLLFDENITIDRRVFMTATERRFAGTGDTIVSMDDAAIYGDTIDVLSFKEALEIAPPVLSDYKIITTVVTDTEIADLIERNAYVRPIGGKDRDELEAQALAALLALRRAMQEHPIKHAISFHTSIARAVAFNEMNDRVSALMPDLGALETFHVAGVTPTSVRDTMIRDFVASERALMTNARCLTEGVDIPLIDCVLFAEPKHSTIDIVQAVGRALRPAAGKQHGYVIVPVFARSGDSVELIEAGAFAQVIRVLGALAANDERIIEHFRAIAEKRPARGRSVSISVDVKLATAIDVAKFAEHVELKVWSQLAKLSWRPFEEAREFARSLRLKSVTEWRQYAKGELPELPPKPADVPATPDSAYRDEWQSWGDWLGKS